MRIEHTRSVKTFPLQQHRVPQRVRLPHLIKRDFCVRKPLRPHFLAFLHLTFKLVCQKNMNFENVWQRWRFFPCKMQNTDFFQIFCINPRFFIQLPPRAIFYILALLNFSPKSIPLANAKSLLLQAEQNMRIGSNEGESKNSCHAFLFNNELWY